MGAIAAAVNRKGEDAVPTVIAMLRELMHRGVDAHGFATSNLAVTAGSIEELADKSVSHSVALGHNFSHILPRDRPQPVKGSGFTLVFEGRLFPSPGMSEVDKMIQELGTSLRKSVGNVVRSQEGSYAFVIALSNQMIAGRDMFGTNPLYCGESDSICAMASERKGLWALGIRNVKSFPPGHVALVNAQGFSFKSVKTIEQPPKQELGAETAGRHLQHLLSDSVKKRVTDLKNVAVAFSGGLDSSVIAVLAKNCGLNVQLVSVGLESSARARAEVEFADVAAEGLGLPLHVQTYTTSEAEKTLPRALWLIEEPNIVKASIAIPIFWTAEEASKLGCNVLLSGQGGDELFGGYQRYLRDYARFGAEALRKILYRDVAKSYDTNFQRDNQVCSFHGVELRLPFVDCNVVHFSLALPLSLKIESTEDKLRKRVLRRVAQNLGIPMFIVNRTKKAVQYSTGVHKAIKTLAKKKGLTLRDYVEGTFRRLHPALEVAK